MANVDDQQFLIPQKLPNQWNEQIFQAQEYYTNTSIFSRINTQSSFPQLRVFHVNAVQQQAYHKHLQRRALQSKTFLSICKHVKPIFLEFQKTPLNVSYIRHLIREAHKQSDFDCTDQSLEIQILPQYFDQHFIFYLYLRTLLDDPWAIYSSQLLILWIEKLVIPLHDSIYSIQITASPSTSTASP
jgi:hypothetical protein